MAHELASEAKRSAIERGTRSRGAAQRRHDTVE